MTCIWFLLKIGTHEIFLNIFLLIKKKIQEIFYATNIAVSFQVETRIHNCCNVMWKQNMLFEVNLVFEMKKTRKSSQEVWVVTESWE